MNVLIRKGDTGPLVKQIQLRVNVRADGIFGPKTEDAVKAYQRQHRLQIDGVVGPLTWRSLFPPNVHRPVLHSKPDPTLSLRERAHRIAVSLLGVTESWGENQGPIVDKIIRANGGTPGESWCGDTMAYCYRLAGSKAVNRSWAAVRLLGFVAGVTKTTKPERGDLVRFNWGPNEPFAHVGMFDHWIDSHTFATIEGNTGPGLGGVYRMTRSTGNVADFLKVRK